MRCRDAERQIMLTLLGAADADALAELAQHLRGCARCVRRAAAYAAVRDEVRRMEPVAPPEEARDFVARAIQEALGAGPQARDGGRPPADPRPERSFAFKALVFLGAVAALVAAVIGMLLAFEGKGEPQPSMGDAVFWTGEVQVSTPGASMWRELGRNEFLPPGARMRTGPDSLLELRCPGVSWRLPGMSGIALEGPGEAELLLGRLHARAEGGAGGDVRLATSAGLVICPEGEFVAALSMKRLHVGCLSGRLSVEAEGGPVQVPAGHAAMLAEGKLVEPVRRARRGDVAHWLKMFDAGGDGGLSVRQLACVRVPAEAPILPPEVLIEDLAVSVRARGPIAVVSVRARLANTGAEEWRGSFCVGHALLPQATAQTGDGPIVVAPGEVLSHESVGVCLMRSRGGFFGLGLNPAVWSSESIGRLQLSVRASADGGIDEFICAGAHRTRRQRVVDWSWDARSFDPRQPVVLEFAFDEPGGVDALWLSGERGARALVAWRPDAPDEEWIRKGRNVFLAFDAAADFGPGGRAYAHEVLEVLLRALPPGCATALLAYDGRVKSDPDPLARHMPARVEAMLSALWSLQEGGERNARDFLALALEWASVPEGDGLLVFVTGRDGADEPVPAVPARTDGELRVATLQVGATEPAAAYRSLCSGSGGVALALSPAVAPELATLDFLGNLQWPALREVGVELTRGRCEGLVTGAARFANQPVLALMALEGRRGRVSGRWRAEAGGERLTRDFDLQMPADAEVAGPAADALIEALRRLCRPPDPGEG